MVFVRMFGIQARGKPCHGLGAYSKSRCRFAVLGSRNVGARARASLRDPQSAWQSECSLPELPHRQRVEADPRGSGIRSQSDPLPAARHAPVGDLHPVPREAGVHQRGPALPGLPCRHSQAATGSELRAVPHGARLGGLDPADPAAQQPLPADRGARGGGLRFLPQRRGQQPVSDDVDASAIRAMQRISETANPNHATAGFSTTCETCHSTDNWLNAKFDHNSVGFPLTGAHTVPPRHVRRLPRQQ